MHFAHDLSRVWSEVVGHQPAPRPAVVAGCGLAALLLVLVPSAWHLSRHVVTIAHEGAHGVVALLSGRRLMGIRLHSDTSGLTLSRGRTRGPGMVLTAFAGYPGPALLGLGAAWLLREQHALAVLWLAVLLLALLLLQIRNFFGLWVVLLAGGAVLAVSWWGTGVLQSSVAYAGTWFLLLASPRPVLEMQSHRRRRRTRTSDADLLASLTPLPALAWVGVLLALTVAALLVGSDWLLMPVAGVRVAG